MTQRKLSLGAPLRRRALAFVAAVLMVTPIFTLAAAYTRNGTEHAYEPTAWTSDFSDVEITEGEVSTFVTFWEAKMRAPVDTETGLTPFELYIATPGIPADILAMGYHSRDLRTQEYLVKRLFDLITDPQHYNTQPGDDPATIQRKLADQQAAVNFQSDLLLLSEEARAEKLDDMKTVLYNFIFDKDSFRDHLRNVGVPDAPVSDPDPEDPNLIAKILEHENYVAPVPDAGLALGDLENLQVPGEVPEAVDGVLQLITSLLPAVVTGEETLPVQVTDPDMGTPTTIRTPTSYSTGETLPPVTTEHPDMGTIPDIRSPETPISGEAAPGDATSSPDMGTETTIRSPESAVTGEVGDDTVITIPVGEDNPLGDVVVITDPDGAYSPIFTPHTMSNSFGLPPELDSLMQRLINTIDSANYNVCVERQGLTAPQCSVDIVVNQGTDIDVTGDGTNDYRVLLSTCPAGIEYPTGTCLKFDLDRLAGATSGDHKAHVFVVFEVPATILRMYLGFDGRKASLAQASDVEIIVKDVTSVVSRDVGLLAKITYGGSPIPAPQVVTFSTREVTYDTGLNVDEDIPLVGSLELATVPSSFTADMRLRFLPSGNHYDFNVACSSCATTKADLALRFRNTAQGSEARHRAIADKMTSPMAVSIGQMSTGTTYVDYEGAAAIASFQYTYRGIPDETDQGDYREVHVDATQVPTWVNLTIAPPTDITYKAQSALQKVAARVVEVVNGQLVSQIDATGTTIPTEARLVAEATAGKSTLSWTANARTPQVDVAYVAKAAPETVANVWITDLPTGVTLSMQDTKVVQATTSAAIGRVKGEFRRGDAQVYTVTTADYFSLKQTATGGVAIGWNVAGFRTLKLDQATANTFVAEVGIEGNQALLGFMFVPTMTVTVDVSRVPDWFKATVTSSSLAYEATDSIPVLKVKVLIPGLNLDFNGVFTDVPTQFTLAWTSGSAGSLAYTSTATQAMTRAQGRLKKDNLDFLFDAQGIPKAATIAYDQVLPKVSFTSDTGIGTLTAEVRVNVPTGETMTVETFPSVDYLVVKKAGTKVGANVKISGLKEFTANYGSTEASYRVRLTPGGQAFKGKADLDGRHFFELSVDALPQDASLQLRPGVRIFHYDAAAATPAADAVFSYVDMVGGVPTTQVKIEAGNFPTRVDLTWTTTSTGTTAVYDASNTLGYVRLFFTPGAGQLAVNVQATTLPPYFNLQYAADSLLFDAKNSASAASGSGSIGTIWVRYGSNGNYPTHAITGDHLVYKQTAAPALSQVDFQDTGVKYVSVATTRNTQTNVDQLLVNVKNAAPRPFTLNTDTPTLRTNAVITNVPANVDFRLVGNTVTYVASDVVTSLDLVFTNLEGLEVDARIEGIPTTVNGQWNPTDPSVSFIAGANIGLLSGKVRVNTVAAGQGTGDFVRVVKTGAGFGATFALTQVKEITVNEANGGYYKYAGAGGQPFSAAATLSNGAEASLDVTAMPTSIAVDLRQATRVFEYTGVTTPGTTVTAMYRIPSNGYEIRVDATGLPVSARVEWATTPTLVATYSAVGSLGSITVKYRAAASTAPALEVTATSLPQWLRIEHAADLFLMDARNSASGTPGSGSVGTVRFRYGSLGPYPTHALVGDFLVYKDAAATGKQVDFADTSVAYVSVKSQNDVLDGTLKNVVPRFFQVSVETPTLKATAKVTSVPTSVNLVLSGGSGSAGSLAYTASAVVDLLDFTFDNLNGLQVDCVASSLPTTMTVSWNPTNPSVGYSSNTPIGSIYCKVRMGGLAAGEVQGDHVRFVKSGNLIGANFRFTNMREATADLANGGYYKLVTTSALPFTAAATINNDVEASLTVSALPTTVTVDLRPGQNSFAYDGPAGQMAGLTITGQYLKQSTGQEARVDLTNVPNQVRLDWVADVPATVTYSSNGVLGFAKVMYKKGASQAAFYAEATNLPKWMRVMYGADQFSFDGRNGALDSSGTAEIQSLLFKYGSNGAFPTTSLTGDFLFYKQDAASKQAWFQDSRVKYVSVDTRSDQVVLNLKNAAARPMTVSTETTTLKLTAVVANVGTSVDVRLAGSTLTYANSERIAHIDFVMDNLNGLVADVDAFGVPPTGTVSWNTAAPSFSLATTTAGQVIDTIEGKIKTNGIQAAELSTGEYARVVKTAAGVGVNFRLTKVKEISVDNSDNGYYKLVTASNGAFDGAADVNGGDILATLKLPALPGSGDAANPGSITVELQVGIGNYFKYDASKTLGDASATYIKKSTGEEAKFTLKGIPTSVRVDWGTGLTPTMTYTASGRMTSADLFFRLANSQASHQIVAGDLPQWFQVQLPADRVIFDARTAAAAVPASSYVGSLTYRYGSNGAFLTTSLAAERLVVRRTSSYTQLDLMYGGIKAADVSLVADLLKATVTASVSRPLDFDIDTPEASVVGKVQNVPAGTLTVDYDGSHVKYTHTSGTKIPLVSFTLNKKNGLSVAADVRGFPSGLDVFWDMTNKKVKWTAPSSVDSASGSAQFSLNGRTWNVEFSAATIPSSWEFLWSDTSAKVVTGSASDRLGAVTVKATNKAAVTVPTGKHVKVTYDTATGDLQAGLSTSSVQQMEFAKSQTGWSGNWNMIVPSGDILSVVADIAAGDGTKTVLTGAITKVPQTLTISQALDTFTYTASANFDLNVVAQAGSSSAASGITTPPDVRGLSVRDGATSGCAVDSCRAVKAKLKLEGAPTSFTINPKARTLDWTGFNPIVGFNAIRLDFDLAHVVKSLGLNSLKLNARQEGIPSTVNIKLNEAKIETVTGTTNQRVTFKYTASKGMGLFVTDKLEINGINGYVEVSNIPGGLISGGTTSMDVVVTYGKDTDSTAVIKTAPRWSGATTGIDKIIVKAEGAVDTTAFNGHLELAQVPVDMNLRFGKAEADDTSTGEKAGAPKLTYSANTNTLDIFFQLKDSFFNDKKYAFILYVADLGSTASSSLSGRTWTFSSSPATTHIEMHVWAPFKLTRTYTGCAPSSCPWLRFNYEAEGGLNPVTVEDLHMRFEGVTSATVEFGWRTTITGSFNRFEYGWKNLALTFFGRLKVELYADWPVVADTRISVYEKSWSSTPVNLGVVFHLYGNHQGTWRSWNTIAPCTWNPFGPTWDIVTNIDPHPHGKQTEKVSGGSTSTEGNKWIVMANPKTSWAPNGLFEDGIVDSYMAIHKLRSSDPGGGWSLSSVCQ